MKNLKLLASLGLSIAINLTKFAELVLAHTINSLQGNSEPYAWTTECGNYLDWRKGALTELGFKDEEILRKSVLKRHAVQNETAHTPDYEWFKAVGADIRYGLEY